MRLFLFLPETAWGQLTIDLLFILKKI